MYLALPLAHVCGPTHSGGRGQVRELTSSDLLSRVREGYTSAQTQTKEVHAQQVATFKEELDTVRHDSDAKVGRRRGWDMCACV